VASAVHIYIREKIPAIAILRCLGVKARQAFPDLPDTGGGYRTDRIRDRLGAGTGRSAGMPAVLKDLLPLEARMGISWWAVGQGITVGLIVSVLFALLPLLIDTKYFAFIYAAPVGGHSGGRLMLKRVSICGYPVLYRPFLLPADA